jgi:hypothetical protein
MLTASKLGIHEWALCHDDLSSRRKRQTGLANKAGYRLISSRLPISTLERHALSLDHVRSPTRESCPIAT